MLSIDLSTPSSVMEEMRSKFRQKRLLLDLTQQGLAQRSGVSLGSVKRFELSGQISFLGLLKLALVLGCLEDFKDIANVQEEEFNTLDDLLNQKPQKVKKRGSKA